VGREEGGVHMWSGRLLGGATGGAVHGGALLHGCWGPLHAVGRARGPWRAAGVRRGAAGLPWPHHVGRHGATLHGWPMGGPVRWAVGWGTTLPTHARVWGPRRALHLRGPALVLWRPAWGAMWRPMRGPMGRAVVGAIGRSIGAMVPVRGPIGVAVRWAMRPVWVAMWRPVWPSVGRAVGTIGAMGTVGAVGTIRMAVRRPVVPVWGPVGAAVRWPVMRPMRAVMGSMGRAIGMPMRGPMWRAVRRTMGPWRPMRPRGSMGWPHRRPVRRPLRTPVVHARRWHGATVTPHVMRRPPSIGARGATGRPRASRTHVWWPLLWYPRLALGLKLNKSLLRRVRHYWRHSIDLHTAKFVKDAVHAGLRRDVYAAVAFTLAIAAVLKYFHFMEILYPKIFYGLSKIFISCPPSKVAYVELVPATVPEAAAFPLLRSSHWLIPRGSSWGLPHIRCRGSITWLGRVRSLRG